MQLMANATLPHQAAGTDPGLRWGRIVVGAIAIEVLLLALAIPLFAVFDNPFIEGASNPEGSYTPIFAAIAIAALVCGALGGLWVARPLPSRAGLHGFLTGVVATALYLGIASIPPNSVGAVFAAYGAFWFLTANGLRIIGAVAGATYRRS
jgi:hypothetical protein